MAFVQPIILSSNGVRLEPLALEHEDGLRAAAGGGAARERAGYFTV